MDKKHFEMVASRPEFANYKVYTNKNGTIIIKVADKGTYDMETERTRNYGIQYQIGHSCGQYWIRHRNGGYIWRLHLNRTTGKYGFKTFEAAFEYFMKYWHKKFGITN